MPTASRAELRRAFAAFAPSGAAPCAPLAALAAAPRTPRFWSLPPSRRSSGRGPAS